MKKEANTRRVGEAYLTIAERALKAWYPNISESERNEMIARADYEELEPFIGAKDPISATLKGLDGGLHHILGIHLPDPVETEHHIIYDIRPSRQLASIKNILGGLNEEQARIIVSFALHEVHDDWVQINKHKFFDLNRRESQFMFTRTALIGWETAKKDLLFIEPTLRCLELAHLDDLDMEACYKGYAEKFRETLGISWDNLVDFLAKGSEFYPVLSKEISDKLKSDPITCRSMVLQLQRANL